MGSLKSPEAIRVLVVDDHAMVVEAVGAALARTADIEVVGTFTSAETALGEAPALMPDVVVLDYELPGSEAAANIQALRKACPAARVLVFTGDEGSRAMTNAVAAGSAGYVVKGESLSQLVTAIRVVHSGGSVFPADLLRRVASERSRLSSSLGADLTGREREVLSLLANGRSVLEIAGDLGVGRNTVRTHIQKVLTKLGVKSQREAVVLALREGLVPR